LKHLPVVVLTTSSDQHDVLTMFRLRCNAYVVKPVDFNEFQTVIQGIVDFWFKIASRPA
jgi:two-component system, chemotaxis family, response regulator Rcp1